MGWPRRERSADDPVSWRRTNTCCETESGMSWEMRWRNPNEGCFGPWKTSPR